MDRYDDLMLGLYNGTVPDWLPEASRTLYERESFRRRCDLGQALAASFHCTLYCAQSLFCEDFTQEVYSAWPSTRFRAENVRTGLYLALDEVLRKMDSAGTVTELLHYEALALRDLRCAPRAPRLESAAVVAAGLGPAEVYRFRYAVTELHARMTLYAGALAPAAFVRNYVVAERATFVTRTPGADGWRIDDVTSRFRPDETEAADDAAARC